MLKYGLSFGKFRAWLKDRARDWVHYLSYWCLFRLSGLTSGQLLNRQIPLNFGFHCSVTCSSAVGLVQINSRIVTIGVCFMSKTNWEYDCSDCSLFGKYSPNLNENIYLSFSFISFFSSVFIHIFLWKDTRSKGVLHHIYDWHLYIWYNLFDFGRDEWADFAFCHSKVKDLTK